LLLSFDYSGKVYSYNTKDGLETELSGLTNPGDPRKGCVAQLGTEAIDSRERYLILPTGQDYYRSYDGETWEKHTIPLEADWEKLNTRQSRYVRGLSATPGVEAAYLISSVLYDDDTRGLAIHRTKETGPELDSLIVEGDRWPGMGDPSRYGPGDDQRIFIPTNGDELSDQRDTTDDILIYEFDGSALTSHYPGATAAGKETTTWTSYWKTGEERLLYVLENDEGGSLEVRRLRLDPDSQAAPVEVQIRDATGGNADK